MMYLTFEGSMQIRAPRTHAKAGEPVYVVYTDYVFCERGVPTLTLSLADYSSSACEAMMYSWGASKLDR